MRLFYALWPDIDTRQKLAAHAARLRLNGDAKLVAPDNYHATLAFVGEAPDAEILALHRIGAAQRAAVCELEFVALEHWAQPAVLVAPAQRTPAALAGLSGRLHTDLDAWRMDRAYTGVPGADRVPLRAHVTLARKVAQPPVCPDMSLVRWRATTFSLVCSQTGRAASIYTVLDTWPLLYEPMGAAKTL